MPAHRGRRGRGEVRHVFADSAGSAPTSWPWSPDPTAWTDEYTDDGTIPLGIYCRASLAEHMDAERLFTETKQGFGFYHRASACATRSTSTTSASFPSSTPERWRTPAA